MYACMYIYYISMVYMYVYIIRTHTGALTYIYAHTPKRSNTMHTSIYTLNK